MARLENQKESKNFEDRTGRWQRFVDRQFYRLLENTRVAYKDLPGLENKLPPIIRPLDYDHGKYTRGWSEIDLTPEEAKMIDKGATHKDILLMRAYKNIPTLVGK